MYNIKSSLFSRASGQGSNPQTTGSALQTFKWKLVCIRYNDKYVYRVFEGEVGSIQMAYDKYADE